MVTNQGRRVVLPLDDVEATRACWRQRRSSMFGVRLDNRQTKCKGRAKSGPSVNPTGKGRYGGPRP